MTKILLVEDEAVNATMIARLLRPRGFETRVAANGQAALAAALSEPPELIVMDLVLGGPMSGPECVRALRGLPATRDIPIIMISASDLASFRDEALQAGANDADTKPVDLDRLVRKMRALLQGP